VRFLFGDLRADGVLEVESLPLPPSVQKAREEGRKVRGSYYFEASVAPRSLQNCRLTERRRETYSAVLRGFDELLNLGKAGRDTPRSPVLFSLFLDTSRITRGKTVVFSVELAVSSTGYEIDSFLWLDQHVEGEYLFRDTITVKATATDDGFNLRYVTSDANWSENRGHLVEREGEGYHIPLSSKKGFNARLRLTVQRRD